MKINEMLRTNKAKIIEEETDYSDTEFTDLMDQKKIQQDIKMFFDRLNELMNPIEKERLKVDSVSQIKHVVKTFYETKQA